MANHGTKQVDMGRIHHASSAWKQEGEAFDSMVRHASNLGDHSQKIDRLMLNVLFPSVLAILAGASVAIQQVLNANLRMALKSAAWSGFVSYFVGVACMALLALALRDPIPSLAVAGRIPWWAYSGGLFGAIFIGLAIFLVPQLGAATFIVLIVTGQMLASVMCDHFGWLGLAQRSIDLPRLIGIALLIGGCVLIRR